MQRPLLLAKPPTVFGSQVARRSSKHYVSLDARQLLGVTGGTFFDANSADVTSTSVNTRLIDTSLDMVAEHDILPWR